MAASGITAALTAAKGELGKADNLTKSVEGKTPSRFAKTPSTQVSYKAARSATMDTPAKTDEATETGAALGAKAENVKAYTDAENK